MSVFVTAGGSEKVMIDGVRAKRHMELNSTFNVLGVGGTTVYADPLIKHLIDGNTIYSKFTSAIYRNELYVLYQYVVIHSGYNSYYPILIKWNGTAWSSVSKPFNSKEHNVVDMTVYNDELHVVAQRNDDDYDGILHYKYNGDAWTELGHFATNIAYNKQIHLAALSDRLVAIIMYATKQAHVYSMQSSDASLTLAKTYNIDVTPASMQNSVIINDIVYLFSESTTDYLVYDGSAFTKRTAPYNTVGACKHDDVAYLILNGNRLYTFNGSVFTEVMTLPKTVSTCEVSVIGNMLHTLGGTTNAEFNTFNLLPLYMEDV